MTIKGKDLIEQISDKEYSEDLIKELEKYEIKKPKTAYDVNYGDDYYFLYFENSEWKCRHDDWWGLSDEIMGRALGLIHLTKERAELHARVLNKEMAIKKWKRENDNVEFDWKNENQKKYYLMYYSENEEIRTDWLRRLKFANTICFSSRDKAQQCINDIGKERIIEWLKWEE